MEQDTTRHRFNRQGAHSTKKTLKNHYTTKHFVREIAEIAIIPKSPRQKQYLHNTKKSIENTTASGK